MSRDLLVRTSEELGARQRTDGLRRLGAVGLLEAHEGRLRLHRLLVHFVRQEVLDPTAQLAVARALISCGEDASQGHLNGSALVAVIPDLIDAAGTAVGITHDQRLAAELCTAVGRVLYQTGDLSAVEPWYERALTIRERVLGSTSLTLP